MVYIYCFYSRKCLLLQDFCDTLYNDAHDNVTIYMYKTHMLYSAKTLKVGGGGGGTHIYIYSDLPLNPLPLKGTIICK